MRSLLVITDGRLDYLAQTLGSAADNLDFGWFDRLVMVDDSGDKAYAAYLARAYPEFALSSHRDRQGLAASVEDGWTLASGDLVFHLEEDFTFCAPVDLDGMAEVLEAEPLLAQVCLKRQPWSPEERAAGGIVEMHPTSYAEAKVAGHVVTLHRRCFSLNPCLIPGRITALGWPAENEAGMTASLVSSGLGFAYWGAMYDPPAVTHIGATGGMGSAGWKP